MINVIIYYRDKIKPEITVSNNKIDVQGKLVGYELEGHAGYADHGEDLVCASISVLSLHTANGLSELTSNDVTITQNRDGYLKVLANGDIDDMGKVLMQSFYLSIDAIYHDYKNADDKNEFINIKFKEV